MSGGVGLRRRILPGRGQRERCGAASSRRTGMGIGRGWEGNRVATGREGGGRRNRAAIPAPPPSPTPSPPPSPAAGVPRPQAPRRRSARGARPPAARFAVGARTRRLSDGGRGGPGRRAPSPPPRRRPRASGDRRRRDGAGPGPRAGPGAALAGPGAALKGRPARGLSPSRDADRRNCACRSARPSSATGHRPWSRGRRHWAERS